LDLAGQVAAIVALGVSIAGLIERRAFVSWSPAMLGACALCVGAWGAFVAIEARRAQPMLPLGLFSNRIFSGAAFVSMVSGATFYGLLFTLGLYFQQVRGFSALETGLAFLPLTASVTVGSIVSNRVVRTAGTGLAVCAALGSEGLGFLGLLMVDGASAYWIVAASMLVIGFSAGLITPAATAVLMGTVEPGESGIAAGVLNSARQTGAAVGVAVFGSVVASSQPFADGMRTACEFAATLLLPGTGVWWVAWSGGRSAKGWAK
jgi:DHA2 family methylenomycin A resistance protein-like MFS transporter